MNQVQYKLIKTYPGSAPINSIFEFMNGMFRATFNNQVFTASDNDVKMSDYFKKINICTMEGKLIRIVQDLSVRGSKQNKTIYRVTGFSWDEKHYQLVGVNNEKETCKVSVNTKNFVEVFQYWFIDSKGKIQPDFHTSEQLMNTNEHSYRKSIGNFFKTKIEASVATIKVTPGL